MTSSTHGFGARSLIASATALISVIAVVGFLIPGFAFAAGSTFYVDASAPAGGDGSSAHPYQTIQSAVTAASAGDTIHITGTQSVTSAININVPLTIEGASGAEIDTTGNTYVFSINPGAAGTTVTSLVFNKTDTVSHDAMILVNANNVTISSDTFRSAFNIGDSETIRGLDLSSVTGVNIHDNTFSHLRQPAYVNNATGNVTNNYTEVTKGWVVVSESSLTFTGNTWGSGANANVDDIVIIPDAPVGANNYTDVMAISQANNNAFVLNKAGATLQQSAVYVNGTTGNDANDGSNLSPLKTIPAALTRIVAGGTVHVAAGTYAGPITITKNGVSLLGTSGVTVNESSNDSFGYGATVDNASNVTVSDIAFSAAALPAGYAFHAYHANGLTLNNLSFTGPGSTGTHLGGVDINTSSNVTLNGVSSTGFYKNGISVTAAYSSADSATPSSNITFNNVSSTGNGWSGVSFYTIGNDHSPASIGGAASITGVSFTGSNTIGSNTGIGLHLQGDTDANEASAATPAYTVTTDGTTLNLSHVAFIPNGLYDIANYQTAGVNALATTFDGKTGADMTPSQRNFQDGKISDKLDHASYGLVKFYEADTTVDTPTILIPASDGIVTNNANLPKIDWTDVTDPSSPVTYNYQVATSPAVNGDGSFTSPIYVQNGLAASELVNGGTPDGTYYFQVQAVDAAGNKSAWTPTMHVTFDSTAPSAPVLTSPADGTTLPTNEFDFTWNASTDASPVTYVFHSSLNPAETNGVLTDGLWTSGTLTSPMIHSSGAPDGTWYWQVQATDAAGNKSDWSPIWTVTLDHTATTTDTQAPVVTVTPAAGSTLTGTTTFTITVTDNQPLDPSKLSHIWVYLYDNAGAQKSKGANVDLSSGTGTFTVDTTLLDDGAATLDVGKLYDAAGNASGTGDSYFKNYQIDNGTTTPPVVGNVTTNDATGVSSSDATLNGTIGSADAQGHSFWVSSTTIDTSSPNIPADVYSTPDMGAAAGNSAFSALLSSLVTNAVVSGGAAGTMPALVPGMTYHYVAWANVGGTWYPGAEKMVTLSEGSSTPTGPGHGAAPTANAQSVSLNQDASTTITFTGSDPEGDSLTYSIATPPAHGTLSAVTGTDVTYTPTAGYSGSDSFTFVANDGSSDSAPATVSITVNAAPPAPVTPSTLTVTPSAPLGWASYGLTASGTVDFIAASDAPTGTGALQLTTSDDVNSVTHFKKEASSTLSDVTSISFATKQIAAADATNGNATLRLSIDLDGNGTEDDQLMYEPYYNGFTGGTNWNTWTITHSNGKFWSNNGISYNGHTPVSAGSYASNFTLADVLHDHPNAKLIGLIVSMGSYNVSQQVAVDDVHLVTSTEDTTYNFEQDPASTETTGTGSGAGSTPSTTSRSRSNGPATTSTGSTGSTGTGSTGGQVLGAAAFNFTRDLHIGMRGDDVTELQTELIAAGYLHITTATGYFGTLTRAAVAQWQADNNISPAAGYFGPISRAKYAADGGFHILTVPVTTPTTTSTTTSTTTPSA